MVSEDILLAMLRMQLNDSRHSGNTHIAQFTPEFVFDLMEKEDRVKLYELKINLASQRYKVFKKSCACAYCGVVGRIMCLDVKRTRRSNGHFNLYGIKPSGQVVMLTKDHIIPKSSGGLNIIDNYQTLCEPCNINKGGFQ